MRSTPIIFIIEDNVIVQNLLEYSISSEINCFITKYSNIHDALDDARKIEPDVVILDYALDGKKNSESNSGLAFLKGIQVLNLKTSVIVFSGQREQKIAIDLIHAGAVDYISKESENFLDEIVTAIKGLLRFTETMEQLSEEKQLKVSHLRRVMFFAILSVALITLAACFF